MYLPIVSGRMLNRCTLVLRHLVFFSIVKPYHWHIWLSSLNSQQHSAACHVESVALSRAMELASPSLQRGTRIHSCCTCSKFDKFISGSVSRRRRTRNMQTISKLFSAWFILSLSWQCQCRIALPVSLKPWYNIEVFSRSYSSLSIIIMSNGYFCNVFGSGIDSSSLQ